MHKRAQIISQLLIITFFALMLLIWAAGHLVLQVFVGAPVTLHINETPYPLQLGEVPLATPLFAASVFVLCLYHELAGFRVTLFLCTLVFAGILLVWSFLLYVPQLPFLIGGQDLGNLQQMILDLSLSHLAKFCFYLIALMGISFFYSTFRWLFKNGFYIVRSSFSMIGGFILASPIIALAQAGTTSEPQNLLAMGIIVSIHCLIVFLILFPLHYLIKWPIFIFVGHTLRQELKGHYSRSKELPKIPSKKLIPEEAPKERKKEIKDDLPNPFSKEDSVVT